MGHCKIHDADASVRMLVKFKLFFQKWRADRWYWGYIFTLRQIIFSCTLLVADDATTQFFFVVVILVGYNTLLALLVPWRLFELNVFEFTLICLLVIMLLSQNILNEPPTNIAKFERVFFFVFCIADYRHCFVCVARLHRNCNGWKYQNQFCRLP